MHNSLFKIKTPFKGISYLTTIVLINSIFTTLIFPIFPLYIKSFGLSDVGVGFITTFIAILLLIYTLLMSKILSKIKKLTLLRFGFLGSAVTLFLFTLLTNIYQFLFLQLFRAFFIASMFITFGLFVREYSTRKSIGKSEGIYYTVANIGFLIGPLVGGLLAAAYSFNLIFNIVAVVQLLIVILLFTYPLKEKPTNNKHEFKIIEYFKNKQLILLYLIGIGLMSWWSLIYTYLPLFADEKGFSTGLIGVALAAVAIPLILFEVPIGRFADTTGFKRYFIIGFLILGVITLLTYFTNPLYTIITIIVASCGAAFIEPLRDAYFFEEVRTKEKQDKLFPIFRSSDDMGALIAPALFSTILIAFNFRGLFIFAGFFMILFALISLKFKR